jgi:molybdenum cofactor synthesis domain-containing protein
LRLAGVTYTGDAPHQAITTGECVEIATGAPLPPGADAVVMVEHTRRATPGIIEIETSVPPWRNVGRRGNDIAQGTPLIDDGDYLTPARIGALAAAGVPTVAVHQRPVVVVASTGNEVVDPGEPLGPGQIHDVNRFTLPPVIRAHGGEVRTLPTVPDDVAAIGAALDGAGDADLVIFTGGSSVGERDLIVDAVRARGDIVFHGVAMKPGKPTLFARLRRTRAGQAAPQLFLGLSGNPTSCLSNAYVLLVPLLRRLAGLPDWRPQRVTAPLARDIVANAGRHLFYPVRLEAGRVVGVFKGSGEITSLSEAIGYIEIPADVDRVPAGTPVTVVLF